MTQLLSLLMLCLAWVTPGAVAASDEAVLRVSFADFYRSPVGPRGLEPGPKLLAAAGARVQLTGFVARGSVVQSATDVAIIAPLPVSLGDEDEGLADDLPAAIAYLHSTDVRVAASLAACNHAVRVTGRLELGRQAERDGRISFVRLLADDVQCAP